MTFRYLVAFGSNIDPRIDNIKESLKRLSETCRIELVSSLYYTSPIGPADQEFVNGALILQSDIEPDEMMARLLKCENSLGRVRRERWGNRVVDLDVLLIMKDGVPLDWNSESLIVPHPEMKNRDFVLQPAAEIAADWNLSGVSIHNLMNSCQMQSILKVEPNTKLSL